VAAAGVALAVSLSAGAAGAFAAVSLTGGNTVYSSPTAVAPAAANAVMSNSAKVAAEVSPSVVSITATSQTQQDTGSGVIIRSDGTIMTNAHVVNGAQQVQVKFSDGKTANATVVGLDTTKDIAVVKAQGVSGLRPATLGDSNNVQVGDPVLAIGSPLGLDGSVTSGIISALNRTIKESPDQQPQQGQGGWPFGFGGNGQQQQQSGASIPGALQTDAPINPGNSGGALVNSSGQVIGINTAILTTGQANGSIGVGFAIPINTAKQVADSILNGTDSHAQQGSGNTGNSGGSSDQNGFA
jgi:putative serine protease PepD